jgi:hypothetical protein
MDPLTYESLTRNPELMRALIEQARRERAAAVHRLLIEPFTKLFRRHAAGTHLRHSRKIGSAAA